MKGWLAKAVTAKRSKRWICSSCDSQSEWEPICKKCGEFSSLEWREERYESLGKNDQSEILPLIVPVTLIRHQVKKYNIEYLRDQVYLNPHPKELMLLNHV